MQATCTYMHIRYIWYTYYIYIYNTRTYICILHVHTFDNASAHHTLSGCPERHDTTQEKKYIAAQFSHFSLPNRNPRPAPPIKSSRRSFTCSSPVEKKKKEEKRKEGRKEKTAHVYTYTRTQATILWRNIIVEAYVTSSAFFFFCFYFPSPVILYVYAVITSSPTRINVISVTNSLSHEHERKSTFFCESFFHRVTLL